MLSNKVSKDTLIDMIYNDLDLEMAIRGKVEEIVKETLDGHTPTVVREVREEPTIIQSSGSLEVCEKIVNYKRKIEERFENEEKEYYYLKGKGISTEMNDINFAVLKEDLAKKEELIELLLEILE